MNIKKSLSVVLVLTIICSCCVLLLSCSSPNEDKQETTTAIVEQTATPETIGTSFEYDPEGDKVPDMVACTLGKSKRVSSEEELKQFISEDFGASLMSMGGIVL